MGKIPSFPILYCVKLKNPPGAKSWEPGSNGAGEPGYFEACMAEYFQRTARSSAMREL